MSVFEGLADKLQNTIKKMRGQGRVTEKDLKEMTREIKLALLEADVNFKVVKDFISSISERALGKDVLESLTPGQQIVKIVHEELIKLLGGTQSKITFSSSPPSIYMLVGLQGAGKTTCAGKIGNVLRKDGKKPLLVACDVYRPAAIKQLQVVGGQLDIPVFTIEGVNDPVKIALDGVKFATKNGNDVVIIDTAGRLHIDEELMMELSNIKSAVRPQEILLVIDSMTGQDAVNVAESFSSKPGIDGIILTKLDGDTRGGAALSVKTVTGKSVKYAANGEKLSDIEPFYPDRMASRILGMGDVLSLIEKAQESFDEKKAYELEKDMRNGKFTFAGYLEQIQQLKKMGPLNQLMGMIPGMDTKALGNAEIDDKKFIKTEAIINSMTMKERLEPALLNGSRRKRIARGSGTEVQDINRLVKEFEEMKKLMKMFSGKGKNKKLMGNFKMPF